MKNTLLLLWLLLLLQLAVTPGFTQTAETGASGQIEDAAQNIALTSINFDDLQFPGYNSQAIRSDRYAGVLFYGPGTQTWLSHLNPLSYPNSLIVGPLAQFPDPYGNYTIYSTGSLFVDFTQPAMDVAFSWGRDGYYSTGTIEIYNESLQLTHSLPINFGGFSWVNFSLNQYNQRIKRVILRRPAISDTRYGHIYLDNFQFTPVSDVQSVVFDPVNQVVSGTMTTSTIDRPTYGDPSQRIFPDRTSPTDTINRKTVRVKAVVGKPNVTVYFKNFDVDDPTADTTVDDTGANGNDNREGRVIGQTYPPSAAGVLSATSAVTGANGEAFVYFTVTKQPGDNFRVAASTDQAYLNGIAISGTDLKDSTNNPLPTGRAKRTELLTVWRKLHMEMDSMGVVTKNHFTGYVKTKGTYVGSSPVWIEVYPSTSSPLAPGYFEENSFQETTGYDGGRMVLGGVHNLQVLDSTVETTIGSDKTQLRVVSLTGNVYVRPNHPFKIFEDDDFNENDGLSKDGDEGENVELLYDSLAKFQASDDPNQNPYAAAYVKPDFSWATSAGHSSSNVPFQLFSDCTPLEIGRAHV